MNLWTQSWSNRQARSLHTAVGATWLSGRLSLPGGICGRETRLMCSATKHSRDCALALCLYEYLPDYATLPAIAPCLSRRQWETYLFLLGLLCFGVGARLGRLPHNVSQFSSGILGGPAVQDGVLWEYASAVIQEAPSLGRRVLREPRSKNQHRDYAWLEALTGLPIMNRHWCP